MELLAVGTEISNVMCSKPHSSTIADHALTSQNEMMT